MAERDFRKLSRLGWRIRTENADTTVEDIRTGCLLRIADAVEVVAENYNALLRENERLTGSIRRERERADRLARSNAAYRGLLKKARAKR